MKEYVISVLTVGLIGAVILLLVPEWEGGRGGAQVRLTVGLVTVAVCVSPLLSWIRQLGSLELEELLPEVETVDMEEYESVFDASFRSAEIENLREGIVALLSERFGIPQDEVTVSIRTSVTEDGLRRPERILLTLYGSSVWQDTGAIEEYLSSLLGCEVITAVGGARH